MITIATLRQGWRKDIAKFDEMIAWIEGGGVIRPSGQNAQKATKAWLETVMLFRAELEYLLERFEED